MSPATKLDIVFGAMTFGKEGIETVRTSNPADAAKILATFQSHSHTEIDTSRVYGSGTSEEMLGSLDWQSRGLSIHTKFYPNLHGYVGPTITHLTASDLRKGLTDSLAALKTDSIDLYYLHAPDRTVPLEETLKAVQDLYQEGKFKRWGISNYMSWEVAAICEICERHGWVKPAVYQGLYNALHRAIEPELLPCLRKYGVAFYAFNPLAGGVLTDRYHRETGDGDVEPGSRFDPKQLQGKMYRARYWNEPYFAALDILRPVAKKHGLRESEVALRWMMHHSQLKREFGDKVIIGASSNEQLEMNLKDFEGAELPGEVVEALDKAWSVCKGADAAGKYWH
jgi:aflatoxin B1 aldehyde reductase